MGASLAVRVAHVHIRPKTTLFSFVLAIAVITGLLFMHVLPLSPSATADYAGGHDLTADMDASTTSVVGSQGKARGSAVHADDLCIGRTTEIAQVTQVTTDFAHTVPVAGLWSTAAPQVMALKSELFSLCVLRR